MNIDQHADSEYGGFAHITEGQACCVFCLTIFIPGLAWLVNACKDRRRCSKRTHWQWMLPLVIIGMRLKLMLNDCPKFDALCISKRKLKPSLFDTILHWLSVVYYIYSICYLWYQYSHINQMDRKCAA